MTGNWAGLAIAWLWALGVPAASAQTPPAASRGALLYSIHCGGCHSLEVHWRDRKIARDWTSLRAQVRRWQTNAGLGWSDQEIVDVTRYLNDQYYHFAPPFRQATAEHRTTAVAGASR
jgi:mono/diheme cytochrome c family protein